jgi:hypothetical protein
MMGRRILMVSGDEYDALTGWRRVMSFRGMRSCRAAIKRRFRRRERRVAREEVRRAIS